MTACVFLGPTLPAADARKMLDAEYLPPVRQGDVYRAVQRFRPRMIGIVDGHFHQVPSVWHKEILFAMAEGVHVFGSASMGALRAAELHPFGMQGVGEVFEAFRDGFLEDDDEVAVVHGPAELGFVAASEAMVNIRRTLERALADGIVGSATQRALTDIAKSLFYPERNYAELLKRGAEQALPEDELAAFAAWLDRGRVDRKRDDALAMLRVMRETLDRDPAPVAVGYGFEHTTMWEAAVTAVAAERDAGETGTVADEWLLDEIRLDLRHSELMWTGLFRLLGLNAAERLGLRIDDGEHREARAAFRVKRHLQSGADLRDWLAAHDLNRPGLDRLLDETLLLEKVTDHLRTKAAVFALDALRLGEDYEKLKARAEAKQRAVGESGDDRELTDDRDAVTWYFKHWMDAPPPEDLNAFAKGRGFRDGADFRRAVMRDYRYRSIFDEADSDDP